MGSSIFKNTDISLEASITGVTVLVGLMTAVTFIVLNPEASSINFSGEKKYPAKAFVIKRQGHDKSKTTYTGIAAGTGMSVDMKFDRTDQKLKLMIKDRKGKPLPRVTFDARANKVGLVTSLKRIALKEHAAGSYRSEPMGLEKGQWVLSLTAYDLLGRGNNKLLFHTEQQLEMKK